MAKKKYDEVIELTKENIEYGVERLEKIERRIRLEKVTSLLFEGGKMCKEIIFCFHNEDVGRKGVCVRLGSVYATAFTCGGKQGIPARHRLQLPSGGRTRYIYHWHRTGL